MWSVNKRYLHDDQFVPRSAQVDTFKKTQADEIILQDTDPNYRVLSFSGDAFSENKTSYWHKSVGGYHAAKLRRYQEMIDRHISPEMQAAYRAIATTGGEMDSVDASKFRVLNMLNTKYFILCRARTDSSYRESIRLRQCMVRQQCGVREQCQPGN